MAGSFSQTIILGNVGKDPDIRTTQGGMKIANLTVATSERWTDKQTGERQEKTEWHRVTCMNEALTVNVIEKFVRKGSKVQIIGQNQTRKWTDQGGIERYSTEIMIGRFSGGIVLCGERTDQSDHARSGHEHQHQSGQQSRQSGGWDAPSGDLDDEIPF